MKTKINHLLGAVLSLLAILTTALGTGAYAASVIPLGDLPGGIFESVAFDVSADGKTVDGQSHSQNCNEAFRWTANGPIHMVGLGGLVGPGANGFFSRANAVSADGSIVVGTSIGSDGNSGEAFRWMVPG